MSIPVLQIKDPVTKQWIGVPAIKGDKGDKGDDALYVGDTPPDDPDAKVWLSTTDQMSNIASEDYVDDKLLTKQDIITVGDGMSIVDNHISRSDSIGYDINQTTTVYSRIKIGEGLTSERTVKNLVVNDPGVDVGPLAFYKSLTETVYFSSCTLSRGSFHGAPKLVSFKTKSINGLIGQQSFTYCPNLETVEMHGSFSDSTFEPYVFGNCPKLKSIVFPENTIKLGYRVAAFCPLLESLDLSNTKLQSMDGDLFYDSNNLIYLHLPNTITKIDSYALRFKKPTFVLEIDLPKQKVLELSGSNTLFGLQTPGQRIVCTDGDIVVE